MHWPPTNQWTAALQPYSLFLQILQRCETGDSISLYSVFGMHKKSPNACAMGEGELISTPDNNSLFNIINTSLSPMYEVQAKVLFSQVSVCPHLWGEGVPHPADGGTPSQVQVGGYPIPCPGKGR